MANQEQLSILRQGSETWNKWRILHEGDFETEEILRQNIDLSGADLRESNPDLHGSKLNGANLFNANLVGVNLDGADFSDANLNGAVLDSANLRGASFYKADLSGATLNWADLSYANFSRANLATTSMIAANLDSARFINAQLESTNLSQARLQGALFTNSKLTGTTLSETVFFRDPNTIKTITDITKRIWSDLRGCDLTGVNLSRADLRGALLDESNLSEADLHQANLSEINLSGVIFCKADLREADLSKTNLSGANLSGANLTGANLTNSVLMKTNVSNARISRSNVFGVNVWDLEGEFEEQKDLIITSDGKSPVTVDNIEIAQFIYLLLNNQKIRDVLNTLTSKTVLILGRFAIPERKAILDALRNKLREYNLLPIVFDFERPTDKDFTETIKTLAGISYFVIADITNPKSSPLELQATVPDYQIPFVPIIQEGEQPFAMMVDLQKKYNWVLPTKSYDSIETLMKALKPGIIDPAVEMRNKLRLIKAQEHPTESLKDYLDKTL